MLVSNMEMMEICSIGLDVALRNDCFLCSFTSVLNSMKFLWNFSLIMVMMGNHSVVVEHCESTGSDFSYRFISGDCIVTTQVNDKMG